MGTYRVLPCVTPTLVCHANPGVTHLHTSGIPALAYQSGHVSLCSGVSLPLGLSSLLPAHRVCRETSHYMQIHNMSQTSVWLQTPEWPYVGACYLCGVKTTHTPLTWRLSRILQEVTQARTSCKMRRSHDARCVSLPLSRNACAVDVAFMREAKANLSPAKGWHRTC